MDPEQTYRVEHIFRPLTAKQFEEYKRQTLHMEKQFLLELERFKAEGPRPKPPPTPIPSHASKLQKERLNIKFEDESDEESYDLESDEEQSLVI